MDKLGDIPITDLPVSNLAELQFFSTQAHKCSYLPDQLASTAFLNPKQRIDPSVYAQLSDLGFRRSGRHIYKPHCQNCSACIPIRIPVSEFKPNRNQKRTWKRNQDIETYEVSTIDTQEHFQLYENYIEQRHFDGDMYPPSVEQFTSFLAEPSIGTRFFEFRLNEKLLAVSVTDNLENGLSAVYTYFDPNEDKRSLGTLAILFLIQVAKAKQLPSVYLGYWIKESSKMCYKSKFRPLEIQHEGRWLRVP